MFEDAGLLYSGLSVPEKSRFISLLGFYLTTSARGGYIEAGNSADAAASKLRGYNEILQTCMKQQLVLLGESINAYPDEEFFRLLERHTARCNCQSEVAWALHECVERFK